MIICEKKINVLPGGIAVIALVTPSLVIVKAVGLLVTTALTGMDSWIPVGALSIWTDVVPSVFCASALITPVMEVVVVVVVGGEVAGSVFTDSTAGIVLGAMSVFEDPDNCSASALGVESALLLALGVPSEFVSAGRAW